MKIRLKHLVGITLALYFLFAIFLGAAFLFQKDIANQETTNQQNISCKLPRAKAPQRLTHSPRGLAVFA